MTMTAANGVTRAIGTTSTAPFPPSPVPTLVSYEAAVLQYGYDAAAGERLNLGVVLWSRDAAYLDAKFYAQTARLSGAFPGFDANQHKSVLNRFEAQLEQRARQIAENAAPGTLPFWETPNTLSDILRRIWSETGLSYQFAEPLSGVSDDLPDTLDALYERFVGSQLEARRVGRKTDETVWRGTYQDALRRHHVFEHLEPHVFKVGSLEVKFSHTYKNGTFHVLKAVSLDYDEAAGIVRRLAQLLGQAEVLRAAEETATLHLLLGKPEAGELSEAYQTAVSVLRRRSHGFYQIVEENEAEAFGERMAEIVQPDRKSGAAG